MPNVEVSCSISNCSFYKEGNLCGAEKIMVDIDKHSTYEAEFSNEFGYEDHQDQVAESAQTCCRTFKPKKLS
ncbi:DUF1540 domain-containing protein [Bacillus salitolerans]|uniref:DUF1540 domain-containing protein n=1 Tax=Bacillus salitolerans TaxID=1437434 RepID=A0ABW4LTL6_9BACI